MHTPTQWLVSAAFKVSMRWSNYSSSAVAQPMCALVRMSEGVGAQIKGASARSMGAAWEASAGCRCTLNPKTLGVTELSKCTAGGRCGPAGSAREGTWLPLSVHFGAWVARQRRSWYLGALVLHMAAGIRRHAGPALRACPAGESVNEIRTLQPRLHPPTC